MLTDNTLAPDAASDADPFDSSAVHTIAFSVGSYTSTTHFGIILGVDALEAISSREQRA